MQTWYANVVNQLLVLFFHQNLSIHCLRLDIVFLGSVCFHFFFQIFGEEA
jgi:hypothetical protein